MIIIIIIVIIIIIIIIIIIVIIKILSFMVMNKFNINTWKLNLPFVCQLAIVKYRILTIVS